MLSKKEQSGRPLAITDPKIYYETRVIQAPCNSRKSRNKSKHIQSTDLPQESQEYTRAECDSLLTLLNIAISTPADIKGATHLS